MTAGGDDDLAGIWADPTACYVAGCGAENEMLLHISADPPGFADLCEPHAREAVEATLRLALTCDCWCCMRARQHFLIGEPT